MLTDCSPFRTGLLDDASAEMAEAHRRAFALPLDAQADLERIGDQRPITEYDLDLMFEREMERRDLEAERAKPKMPVVVPGVEMHGRKYKGVLRIDGKRVVVGTFATEADAMARAYAKGTQVLAQARQNREAPLPAA